MTNINVNLNNHEFLTRLDALDGNKDNKIDKSVLKGIIDNNPELLDTASLSAQDKALIQRVASSGDADASLELDITDDVADGLNTFNENIIVGELSKEREQEIQSLIDTNFSKFDSDGNGFITKEELLSKLNDNSIKGKDAAFLATLFDKFNRIKESDSGLSKEAIKDDLRKFDGFNDYQESLAKIAGASAFKKDDNTLTVTPVENINPGDVIQGHLGDCIYLATLASMASSDTGSQRIADMITDNEDGTFTVNFPDKSVTITSPTDTQLALYGSGDSWVPIMEKAYGVYLNGSEDGDIYAATDPGQAGFMANRTNSISILTGNSYDEDWLIFGGKDATRDKLEKAVTEEKTVWAGVVNAPWESNAGIPRGHAYAILDYDRETDLITIKNPQGQGEPIPGSIQNPDQVDEGIFQMTLDEFYKNFSSVYYEM